ncbi:uncharacterized protein V3H82_021912 [Fundulus diaphanus]
MHQEHYGLKIIVILQITVSLYSIVSSLEVVCHFMESCILPCNLKNGDELVLHWFYTEANLLVHSFYQNQDQLGTQDQRFRDRTSLFKDQFPRHNYSLKLTEVRIQDEGRYKCFISTTTGNRYSFINLKVEAPVSKVSLSQVENRITCSSDGIYPEPELTWSINPPSTALQNRTTVQQTDKQLYSISSSLMVSGSGSDLTYSCTVGTLGKKKTATVRQLSTSTTPSVTTIHCPGSNTSTTGLIWRFNQTQIILNQTKANLPLIVSEEWRKHVKDVSESGSLTLQDMTSDKEGVYTCEVSKEDETIITNISVRISPDNPAGVALIIIGVITVLAIIAVIIAIIFILKRRKNAGGDETGQIVCRPNFISHLNLVSLCVVSDTDVSCVFMESCLLPCSFQSSREVHIHWIQLTDGPVRVHSFHSDQNQPRLQDRRLRGRSSLFRDQISGGNASLLLTGVKVEDEGRYECFTNSSGAISHSFINVTVDAPVRKIKIEQVENRISCSSEGIYPNPEHSWSFKASAKTGVQSSITVSRTEEHLYNINSSLTVSEAVSYLVYSCSFSTRRSKRKVTLFRPISVSVPKAEATINCSDWNLTVTSLVWRFNHSWVLLSKYRTDANHSVAEDWRKHVKGVSESGSLTLRDLSSNQEGLYTCELSNTEEEVMSSILLTIEKNQGDPWIPPPAAVAVMVGVILLGGTAAFLLMRFMKQ